MFYWTEPAAGTQTQTVTNTCSSILREQISQWTRYSLTITSGLNTQSLNISFNLCFYFQDGINTSEKKAKRHLETEGLDAERRVKDKKHSHKRQKMNKKNLQRRLTSTSSSPRSDFSQSDESDEEMAMCPAERCQQPEGDEVRKTSLRKR